MCASLVTAHLKIKNLGIIKILTLANSVAVRDAEPSDFKGNRG